jgi:mono/diheme cytochrome c family protein
MPSTPTIFALRRALATSALVAFGLWPALAAGATSSAADGKQLLEKTCARCHAIEATGDSPLKQAPPLRDVYRKYPAQELQFEFAEGMGSRHKEMPQIQFSSEQVDAILTYLSEISGEPPPSEQPALTPDTGGGEPP